MPGSKPEVWDYLDWVFLYFAKLNRRKLGSVGDQSDFYNSFFTESDIAASYSGIDRRRRYRGDLLRSALSTVSTGKKVLDVGCGIGDNLNLLLEQGRFLYGIEYSQASAKIARKTLPEDVNIALASATYIPFQEEYFDAAMCIEVLEHIPDQYSVLREIRRILKKDGLLVLSVPFRHWFKSYYPLMGHIRHYTRTELTILLEQCGFEVMQYVPNFPRWSRFANYCYVTCQIVTRVMRLFGIRKRPLEIRLPFGGKLLVDILFDAIEPIRRQEFTVNYRILETSTFVVAKRV